VTAVSAAALLFLTAPIRGQSPPPERLAPGLTVASHQTAEAASERTRVSNWPRIYIKDVYVRDAVRAALQGASEWLGAPRCQALLTEFSDTQGRALRDRLTELKMSLAEYLRMLIVEDDETHAPCTQQGVLAFTVVGSRVIHVCGRTFARAAERDAQEVRATMVHELLHSLGLGENPPSPRYITYRVQQLCW
jgi:hypothetical protein